LSVILIIKFLPSQAQTCIVLVKRYNDIFIAADSRQTIVSSKVVNGKIIQKTIQSITCKIKNFKNIYFAISGEGQDTIYQLAEKSCRLSKNIYESSKKFKSYLMPFLKDNLIEMKQKNKPFFEQHFKSRAITKIAFFGFENKKPYTINMVFFLKKSVYDPIDIDCNILPNSILNNGDYQMYVLGKRDLIDALPKLFTDTLMSYKDLSKSLRYLIRLEMNKYPSEISEPIDILNITEDGVNWISKKELCN